MLEAATLLVSIAAVIVSAVVPFVSVWAAQRLVHRNALRQSVREAFREVNRHVQEFRTAFLAHYTDLSRGLPGARDSMERLHETVTAMNGDCLYLGLLFGRTADRLGSQIQQLAGKADVLFSPSARPAFENCDQGLRNDIEAICQQMKPLWESLK